jgi:hypothetical protein
MRVYSFASIMRDAQRARWSLDEVAAGVHELDFRRPFLPEALVHFEASGLQSAEQRLILNHVRAHSYLQLFALVERFILPFAMQHAAAAMRSSAERLLALMQFGEEEAKHIALFERFSEAFEFGFGSHCEVVGPADAVADEVLSSEPLAVGLLVLHIEWMTQEHYTQAVRGREDIDPQFESLLRHHWMEEAQHARIDTLLLEDLLADANERERERSVRSYLSLLDRLDGLFALQVELDREALEFATGELDTSVRTRLCLSQHASYREVFLRAGTDHPRVREFIRRHFGGAAREIDAASRSWRAGLVTPTGS